MNLTGLFSNEYFRNYISRQYAHIYKFYVRSIQARQDHLMSPNNAEAYRPWIWKRQGIHTMLTIHVHIINVILQCILMF
jgi:hypothetical protein